jgi:hypothetical protein
LIENLKKIKIGQKYHWKWQDWLSPGFDFLEERYWTPVIIASQLCFVVCEHTKRFVVWGNYKGTEYDDVYGLTNYHDQPLYIASKADEFFLVLGKQESQHFNFQISYELENEALWITKFSSSSQRQRILLTFQT